MNIDTFRLQAFYTLSQTKHFAKASERLSITQSALSQRIAKLEDDLETTLFIRERAGIKLTPSGLELLRYCQSLNQLEEEFLQSLWGEKTKCVSIRVGAYSSILRSLVLPSLQKLSLGPSLFQFEFLSKEIQELPSLLISGSVDYLILDRILDKADVESLIIGQEEQVLIRARNKKLQTEVYLDHDQYLKAQGEKNPKIQRSFMDDIYGIIDGVKLGFGQAVVSKHLIDHDKEIEIISSKKKVTTPIVLHFYKKSYYPKYHQQVLDCLKS
jgi:DNA-binding transcriptional LysR family regulator